MEKYLVFRLEKWVKVNIQEQPRNGDIVLDIYLPPVFENRKFPCFELIKEFEIIESSGWTVACHFAQQYSVDHELRTVVVRGDVFGD
jgi:hypothetical protein